ncbi:kinesin-like protein KIN-5A [Dendronephthya gigantea]|uniref:kinesin-like protein KIN-5A n=1 Tax=Dendronephthya gigantea TaxID=151771 RepID=UPI00106D3461|nr:kinesin-like protein KIN-5A [Dendronephthya gigantea]
MKRTGSKRQKSGVVKIGRATGRVKCFIRVRPMNDSELEREDENAVEVSADKKEVLVNDTRVGLDKTYQFDHVFPPKTTNPQISNFISKPLVNAALNGFNGTVMAYGQTGSGKTYTLMSPDGVAATIIEKSFRKMASHENLQYKVSMSYLQIYQEKIYDLLNNAASSKIDLTIREHPQKGIYVENLSEYVVRGPAEVYSLMELGKKRLIFAETKMNRTSSRSHSVCILSIERSSKHSDNAKTSSTSGKKQFDKKLHATLLSEGVESPAKMDLSKSVLSDEQYSSESDEEDDALTKMMAFNEDVVLKGHLYICDLAGSERIKKTNAEGERLSEAQHINFSLLELGNVIQALAESADTGRAGHIPFRNSTLTRLLQESLGGNCKTSLIVCCSPSDNHVHETKCSLNFGSRAMKVRNTAYVNVEMDYKKLSDDLAKLLDAKDKEIEELKLSQKRQLELSKKDAELAAEMKFGDGLSEARKAYAALKHLLDSQASAHAESMAKLQAELSREKDARLALEEELQNKRHSSNDKHSSTKSLLLTEVLSMQLYYAIECTACRSAELMEQASKELSSEDVAKTQEEILENVDNLIGVLGTYLNLTEREFSEARNEDYVSDEDIEFSENDFEGRVGSLETLVVKIRKRLKVLKDSVDGRTLRFLNKVIEKQDRSSMENMKDVYHVLQKLLEAREDSSDPEFLGNSQDAERCLTYVLLDKALLCCLVVLERKTSDKKLVELGRKYETTVQELEVIRHKNKSLKNDNERLVDKLRERRGDTNVPDSQSVEALLIRNSGLMLEVKTLRKKLGSKWNGGAGTGNDIEMAYWRERVGKLTKENEKLEFMMKVMGDRFSQDEVVRKPTREAYTQVSSIEEEPISLKESNNSATQGDDPKSGKLISTYDSETITTSSSTRPPATVPGEPEVEKVISFTSANPSDSKDDRRTSVSKIEKEEFREHLLKSKMESEKTLKHLFEIKVDETLEFLDKNSDKSKKLNRLVDSAIDSAEHTNMNAELILTSSMDDIEALERDISAIKVNNEALGRQCLSLVKDRATLETLLTDLHGDIAGLQEKVAQKNTSKISDFPTVKKQAGSTQADAEIKTDVYRIKTTSTSPPSIQVQSWETESVKKVNLNAKTQEFETRDCQTDVSFVTDSSNESGESDGPEDQSGDAIKTDLVVEKLSKKYSLVKQLVKHLEGEVRNFKIKTTALETELKERQHLKDENKLLEEEVKELQGLKIYLESQLAEGDSAEKPDNFGAVEEESNLKKWKNFGNESFSDLSSTGHLSSSSLNLTSLPSYTPHYQSMSRSMMDLSEPQMYTSFSSLRSSRGSFGSLKMLKLEMEGKPSRIRDKLKSASLLLQHTGSLESQLKASRQKCFRLEGEVCKLVKEKKEISEELDKVKARLRADESAQDVEVVDKEKLTDASLSTSLKPKRRSFKLHRGKEEKDRLKNELTLAREQLTKLKSQLEMANTSVNDSAPDRRPGYSELSEDEKRREKELALTRERCLILAEELGASNKEKIKLADDLQEAVENIEVLANEVKRFEGLEEEKFQLQKRVEEFDKETGVRLSEVRANGENLVELRSEVASLLEEKANLEDSISELKWEKERLNEMENIVKRLVQVEREKGHLEQGEIDYEVSQECVELMKLRKDNEDLREQLASLNEAMMERDIEFDKGSKNTPLTQVLSAVKDGGREEGINKDTEGVIRDPEEYPVVAGNAGAPSRQRHVLR